MSICKIKNCKIKHKALGYCNRHYRRFKVHGDPHKVLIDHNMEPGESTFNILFSTYKVNAWKRMIKFNLKKEDFRKLTKNNCYYCDKIPSSMLTSTNKKAPYIYNGIDRLDSTKNYSKKNCVTCCGTCNFMKRELTKKEFLDQVKRIYENIK